MMSSTFGALLGGTTVGGHQGFESLASSLITPPNCGGGGGSCFPSMVMVALGDPGVPVICWPMTGIAASMTQRRILKLPSDILLFSYLVLLFSLS